MFTLGPETVQTRNGVPLPEMRGGRLLPRFQALPHWGNVGEVIERCQDGVVGPHTLPRTRGT